MTTLRTWWRRGEILVTAVLFAVLTLPIALLIAAVIWEPPHRIAYSMLMGIDEIARSEWRAALSVGETEGTR